MVHARAPVQVDDLGHKHRADGNVEPHRKLKRVIVVAREAEAVVEEKELICSVAIAVEDLLTSFDCAPIFVHKVEVSVVQMFLWVKPTEFFIRFLAAFIAVETIITRFIRAHYIKHFWRVWRHIVLRLANVQPFILLQGPLGDGPEQLAVFPPFLRCINFIGLRCLLVCHLYLNEALDILLLLIHEKDEPFLQVFHRRAPIRKQCVQIVEITLLLLLRVRIFLCIVVLRVLITDAGYVPQLDTSIESGFELFY